MQFFFYLRATARWSKHGNTNKTDNKQDTHRTNKTKSEHLDH